jgi:hypothetical protein
MTKGKGTSVKPDFYRKKKKWKNAKNYIGVK